MRDMESKLYVSLCGSEGDEIAEMELRLLERFHAGTILFSEIPPAC